MKTRETLIQFLKIHFPMGETKDLGAVSLADALIASPWVQLDKPQKWHVCKTHNKAQLEPFGVQCDVGKTMGARDLPCIFAVTQEVLE